MKVKIVLCLIIGNVHAWWELVFKVVTGGPFGAYNLFINNGTRNINNLAAQQLTNQVLDHYKSDVMDDMHSNGVTKIRVSYYSGGVEAQFFVFDAVGANKTGWFSRHRLLETSYDITAFGNTTGIFGEYFSLEGFVTDCLKKFVGSVKSIEGEAEPSLLWTLSTPQIPLNKWVKSIRCIFKSRIKRLRGEMTTIYPSVFKKEK
uniref:Uncharacterized protein n=1 Tax=Magallana gigas TaxID=29159 RepID=K1RVP7_MAGGI